MPTRDRIATVARYRHYENSKEPGITLFVTTTVLDFVHAFHRPDVRDGMMVALAKQCQLGKAALYGFTSCRITST